MTIMARLKLKNLEESLQLLDDFQNPKIHLEQYSTPPHIASCMLYSIQMNYDDFDGKIVADLGCGCGRLSIGSALMGAQTTVGFDIDDNALNIFRENVIRMELTNLDVIQSNILLLPQRWNKLFDTVIMNPPFGTKNNAGIDIQFLQTALRITNVAVYSLHKSSTRNFIHKKAAHWQVNGEVIAEMKFNINASYKFHKRNSVDINVDLWRFEINSNRNTSTS